MVPGSAIATLVVFILSIIIVIRPVAIPIPFRTKKRYGSFPLNLTTAPIIAIAVLWASQCLGPTEIRQGIVQAQNFIVNWEVEKCFSRALQQTLAEEFARLLIGWELWGPRDQPIRSKVAQVLKGTAGVKPYNIIILFFSLAYMAITLDISGVLQAAAYWVSNKGGSSGYRLFVYFYIMLTALSVFIGNDPVILSGTAFLVYYAKVTELEPLSWLISEFAAANTASMVLFVGNPTNVVICEGFSVNNVAFTAYTILPFLGCSITCLVALGYQFRASKYIPKHLPKTENLDVRSVLRDPISAWVGSFMLGTCLVVIIVVSFFHIDVWMISLPFAFAKFLYDMGWDHYCYKNNFTDPKRKPTQELDVPDSEKTMRNDRVSTNRTFTSISQTTTIADRSPPPLRASPVPNQGPDSSTPTAGSFWNSLTYRRLEAHFPTFFTALPRLPFGLVPFAFSQFILIEALARQGWINIFANWLVLASSRKMYPVIWLVGVLGVILCNISGTNIGATILLTQVVRAAALPDYSNRAAAIALAVASNIGAVSFTFSASLAGLLWTQILRQKGVTISQVQFAHWNALPLLVMTVAGLGIVSAEMAVLYPNAS